MEIPSHKIVNPSEGKADLMLLPTVSVQQKERIDKFLKNPHLVIDGDDDELESSS